MEAGTGQPPKTEVKGRLPLFLAIFAGVGLVLAAAIYLVYWSQNQQYLDRLKLVEGYAVDSEARLLDHAFGNVAAGLAFLTKQQTLHSYLEQGDPRCLEILEQEYKSLSLSRTEYRELRFLDHQGHEVVRVHHRQESVSITPRSRLRNRAGEVHFQKALALKRGQVFISPVEVKAEQGRDRTSLNPEILLGMPVFDQKGDKRGVVMLHYLAGNLLQLLDDLGKGMAGKPLLINPQGYWLLGPREEDAWGFALEKRRDRNLFKKFPLSASLITDREKGQFVNREGLFTFRDIHPLDWQEAVEGGRAQTGQGEAGPSGKGRFYWKLVSHVSQGDLEAHASELLKKLLLFGVLLFVLNVIASILIANSIIRNKIHRSELLRMARYDALTGLPNRFLYFDRLTQAHEISKRNGYVFGVLILDLDGFKKVNDTLGHPAGDQLLIRIARRLEGGVRKSDTVGRMGGDEFMVILNRLARPEDAEQVAQSLLRAINQPVLLGDGEVSVGGQHRGQRLSRRRPGRGAAGQPGRPGHVRGQDRGQELLRPGRVA